MLLLLLQILAAPCKENTLNEWMSTRQAIKGGPCHDLLGIPTRSNCSIEEPMKQSTTVGGPVGWKGMGISFLFSFPNNYFHPQSHT